MTEQTAERLRVFLLGRFEVRAGEELIIDRTWSRRKAAALLALLALNKGTWFHREQVLDLLWPDLDPAAAANNLRKNLHYLRAAFAARGVPLPVVSAAGEMLALSPEAWVDLEEFRDRAGAARTVRTDPALYEEALALYAGDLLPEELYEQWTEPQREELKALRDRLLIELSQVYEVRGRTPLAVERLEQLLKGDPLQEEAHRSLMRLYAQGGDRQRALRQYERCREALQRELGVGPSAETEALHRQTREGRLRAPALAAPGDGAFVGREEEVGTVRAALDDALSGRGRLVMLVGEPGIGKTRTAQELSTYAALRGAEVLWGRCYEGEGAPAYWPWVQIIRSYVADREAEELMSIMGPGAADIAEVVPEVREQLPDLPPAVGLESEQARFRLFDSIARFFKNASSRRPLVLVFDDLHWADKPSLLLLEFLSREMKGAALMVLGSYRDVEVDRSHPLASTLGELSREHPACRVQLGGLAEPEVARFIEINAGIQPLAALVDAVHRETEGNPFFVKEIVHLLAAEGRLDRLEAAGWKLAIPQGVREVIARRLDHVSTGCRNALSVASVIGREFGLNVLERVTELKDDHVLESLDEAVTTHLIDEAAGAVGAFRFSHALIRETLYDELPMTRRVRLHREVGEAIERTHAADLDLRLAELAHHFFQAIVGGTVDKAIDYARRAGDRALGLLAYEEAARLYEMALQALDLKDEPDEGLRCELLLALGDAWSKSGDTPKAKGIFLQAADVARKVGAAERLARAALGYAGAWTDIGVVDREQLNLLNDADKALSASGAAESTLRARVLARLARDLLWQPGSHERVLAITQTAVEIARRTQDAACLVHALAARWESRGPHLEESFAASREIVMLAEQCQDRELALLGQDCMVGDMLVLGNREGLDAVIKTYDALAEESRLPLWLWNAAAYHVLGALIDGRFDEAERLAFETLSMGRRVYSGAEAFFAAHVVQLRYHQGRLHEIEGALRAFSAQRQAVPYLQCATARLHARLGRESEARAAFEPLASNNFADLPWQGWISAVAMLVEVCVTLGDVPRSAILYDLLLPCAAYHAATLVAYQGSVPHYLGLLATTMGRWREAQRHFEDALEMHEKMRSPPWLAHTRYEYARMLLARGEPGDREKAQALLSQALATARELGMQKVAAEAEALMPSPAVAAGAFRTVLFTDVEGSTALTQRLGDAGARDVLREHERLVREALRAHGGTEVKAMGDGFMASFSSATSALECAIAVQRAFAEQNETAPVPLRVRVGLNAGEPIAEQDDLFGTTVNVAARIAAQAKGSEVLASDVVRQLVAGKGFLFADRGDVALRGFEDPVRLFEVAWQDR
ncbi:MAG: AAA family ATPase [Chloroflexi bacterium]|nr:AAA family ATPase [Chloroflexota bacterium]